MLLMYCSLQIVHVLEIDAKEAVYMELPNNLSETLKCALNRIGISGLYSHQVSPFFCYVILLGVHIF